MQIFNPYTKQLLADIESASPAIIADAFNRATHAQTVWSQQQLKHRIECVRIFGLKISECLDELAHILSSETGKPITQARNEIRNAQARIDFFVTHSEKWLAEEWMVSEGSTREVIRYEALGVIANISAWNYPYNVGYNVLLPALIGGNAVLYKPSEFATLTGLEIVRCLHAAGIPQDVVICLPGDGSVGAALTQLPLDGYYFTGSYATGKKIAEAVAHKLVPVGLELGGKDPVYVTDNIPDIEAAAAGIADGAFYNNGQSCCAVERVYIHENVYEKFKDAFVKEVKSYVQGDPSSENTYTGPLTRSQALDVLKHQVDDAVSKGAVVECGGDVADADKNMFQNTVLSSVNHEMLLMKEESFGPVIGLMKVSSDEEAIQYMNDSSYGLTAAVYTSDNARADAIFEQLDAGTVYLNCCDRVSPFVPWSGRKNSGMGSTLSHQGIRAFVRPKAYHLRG
jgi:acyl-CoA reductase-like NAD-dependent aldehyde dehydrogenase